MKHEKQGPLLYSILDAAEAIGVKRSTMYELITRGEVTTVSIGRRRLVTADSLERYVERLKEVEQR